MGPESQTVGGGWCLDSKKKKFWHGHLNGHLNLLASDCSHPSSCQSAKYPSAPVDPKFHPQTPCLEFVSPKSSASNKCSAPCPLQPLHFLFYFENCLGFRFPPFFLLLIPHNSPFPPQSTPIVVPIHTMWSSLAWTHVMSCAVSKCYIYNTSWGKKLLLIIPHNQPLSHVTIQPLYNSGVCFYCILYNGHSQWYLFPKNKTYAGITYYIGRGGGGWKAPKKQNLTGYQKFWYPPPLLNTIVRGGRHDIQCAAAKHPAC